MSKILFVCNSGFFAEKFLGQLMSHLELQGHEVHLCCPKAEHLSFKNHHQISFPNSYSFKSLFKSIKATSTLIKKHQFDCVISNTRNASVIARIAARINKTPLNIYTANGFYFHDDQSKFAHRVAVSIERALAKITTHTISQAQEDIDLMVGKNYIHSDKISWIGNGVDINKYKPVEDKEAIRKSLGLPKDSLIIASVGRIVKGKGFQDLVRAFAKFQKGKQNVHLLMIGGTLSVDISPYEKEIKELIEKNDLLNKVTLTGMVNNVEQYLAASDLFVHPSYREGMSKSMLEAMSCQLACVVSKIRGAREIIKDNQNGFMFEAHDIKHLASLLDKLYSDRSLLQRISKEARNTILKKFTEAQYIDRQATVINKLLKQIKSN